MTLKRRVVGANEAPAVLAAPAIAHDLPLPDARLPARARRVWRSAPPRTWEKPVLAPARREREELIVDDPGARSGSHGYRVWGARDS